ncbi:MAG: NAD(P)/FAD-dependent oxidoreductase [Thermodesulfobacteriota bacterium]
MTRTKYLIIGNSAAAVGCVEGIRQADPDGEITIVAKEKEHAYSRPLITYLLGGKVDEAGMAYRPADFYAANRVTTLLGVEAVKVDPEARSVACADGRVLGYEQLLIANGGRPIVPPALGGADAAGVFTFTTWQDARDIEAYIQANRVDHAVVIGGGLIGLKSVEALTARKLKVTVLELAPRILAVTLDQDASNLLAGALAGAGVELLTNTTAQSIDSTGGKVSGVTLPDGRKIACGLVILAIGVLPDLSLVAQSGIATDRGILVDERMAASAAHVYAAGDVAQAPEMLSGERRSIPIWPNAYRQGFIAGTNMAGGDKTYEGGLAMNSVEICGLATISAGVTSPPEGQGYEVLTRLDPKTSNYRKLVVKDGRLVGYVLVGDVDRAGIITGLIKGRVEVKGLEDKLLAADFGLISLPARHRERVTAGLGVWS